LIRKKIIEKIVHNRIIGLTFAPNDTEMWLHVHRKSRSLQIGFYNL